MKTLPEMVDIMAKGMFHNYMGGGVWPRPDGASAVATVFEVSEKAVLIAVEEKYEQIKKEYYDSPEVQALKI